MKQLTGRICHSISVTAPTLAPITLAPITLVTITMMTMILVTMPVHADWQAGAAAFAAGDYETAAEHFAAVVKSNPSWPGGHLMLGRCALAQDDPAKAVDHLQVAYGLAPEVPDHLVALGRALLANKDHKELLTLLQSTDRTRLRPEVRVETTVLMARAALGTGDPAAAVELLQEALVEDSESAVLARTLGLMRKSNGDRSGAIEALARAYELDPENVASANLAVQLALTEAAEAGDEQRSTRYGRALELASMLATASPSHEHQLLAGEAALGLRDLATADHWFAAAVQSQPDDPLALYYRGRTRTALGHDEAAVDNMRRALAAKPNADLRSRIHGQLGRLEACQLELAKAAEHYRNAGDSKQATRIDEVASASRDALAALARLRSELAELRGMETQLRELGDGNGVTAIGERITAAEGEIKAVEDNLEEVRTALCS